MKLRRWLSRGIVLAMVVALMVPMPVAAKSSKSGGKLVKSVEYYDYNNGQDGKYGTADDKYVPTTKYVYTYDKKNNPNEVKTYNYYSYFLNVPVNGDVNITSFKYKYKGKTPKSMKASNDIGYVTASRKYTKGKVTSYSGVQGFFDEEDGEYYDFGTTTRADGVQVENSKKVNGSIAYNKNGNVTATCQVSSITKAGVPQGTEESNRTYFVNQKKGIPSYIYRTGNSKDTAADGKVTVWDGSVEGGEYTTFNGKGLAVQQGDYSKEGNKYVADRMIQYVMKKGNVAEAVIFSVDSTGKQEAVGKYVFKYGKTKVSKQRYMNMINSFVTYWDDYYFWY